MQVVQAVHVLSVVAAVLFVLFGELRKRLSALDGGITEEDERTLSQMKHHFSAWSLEPTGIVSKDGCYVEGSSFFFSTLPNGNLAAEATTPGVIRDQKAVPIAVYDNPRVTYAIMDMVLGENPLDPNAKLTAGNNLLFAANGFSFQPPGNRPDNWIADRDETYPEFDSEDIEPAQANWHLDTRTRRNVFKSLRFFAVFDEDTARAPVFLDSYVEHHNRNPLNDQENSAVQEACKQSLKAAYEHCKPASRKLVELQRNGFTLDACSYCQYTTRDGIHAMFAGEVSRWPDGDAVAAAHNAYMSGQDPNEALPDEANWLVNYFEHFKDSCALDLTDAVLTALNKVEGSFAFLLFDEKLQRVLAARDREGIAPLYWGTTTDGRFMVGTSLEDMADCTPSATPFPAGSLYVSDGPGMARATGKEGWVMHEPEHRGSLFSFVESKKPGKKWRELKAIPRLTPEGQLCGSVYKVNSEMSLAQEGQPGVKST